MYVESRGVAGSCRNISMCRLRVRSTLSMDAGAAGEIHGQKSLRPVPRRTAEGARRDAETAEGAHRRRGAGGVAQPGVPEPVRVARRLESAERRQEDGRAGTDGAVHAAP